MNDEVKDLINTAVSRMIGRSGSNAALKKLRNRHAAKTHFIPIRYRVFGGLLQSLNIKFGNFIETLMTLLVENDHYEVLKKYSGKRSNTFSLSVANDNRIDAYISHCQSDPDFDVEVQFPCLLEAIAQDDDENFMSFTHDIDLLFKDNATNITYYVEVKYNDDHDTGKFVDINRKFIKTYAYLCKELRIEDSRMLVPSPIYRTAFRLS